MRGLVVPRLGRIPRDERRRRLPPALNLDVGGRRAPRAGYPARRGQRRRAPHPRRHVAKGRSAHLALVSSDDAEPLYRMHKACYEAQGQRIYFDLARFRQFVGRLLAEGGTALWYMTDGVRPVAGMLVNRFRKT